MRTNWIVTKSNSDNEEVEFYKEVYDREYAYKEKCLRTKEIKK